MYYFSVSASWHKCTYWQLMDYNNNKASLLLLATLDFFLGNATRPCNSMGEWEAPIVTECSSYEYRSLMDVMLEVDKMYNA